MQELTVLWMNTDNEMNLDTLKYDVIPAPGQKSFREKRSPITAKIKEKIFLLI